MSLFVRIHLSTDSLSIRARFMDAALASANDSVLDAILIFQKHPNTKVFLIILFHCHPKPKVF